jgi:hypothetical protein
LLKCHIHRYRKSLNRLLKVCYVPSTSAVLIVFFSSFLLRPLTVLMKQRRRLVHTIKQSIYLNVYGHILGSYIVYKSEKINYVLTTMAVVEEAPS